MNGSVTKFYFDIWMIELAEREDIDLAEGEDGVSITLYRINDGHYLIEHIRELNKVDAIRLITYFKTKHVFDGRLNNAITFSTQSPEEFIEDFKTKSLDEMDKESNPSLVNLVDLFGFDAPSEFPRKVRIEIYKHLCYGRTRLDNIK